MIAATLLGSLNPKQMLAICAGVLLLVAAVSFGSYILPAKELTARKGPVSFIPRDYREWFVSRRAWIGSGAASAFVLVAAGWLAAEWLARTWQKRRNEELAGNGVLLRIAPRVDEISHSPYADENLTKSAD